MQTGKRKKRSAILILLFIISIFIGITVYNQYSALQDKLFENTSKVNKNINTLYTVLLKTLNENLSIETDYILQSKDIANLLKDKNKEKLLEMIKPLYDKMVVANPYLKVMTFRSSDGITVLRVHKPALFGDKISTNRKIIIDVNKQRKRMSGFEIGKLKMAYRVVTPIFRNKEYVGSLEIGVEPEYITDVINNIFEIKYALFVRKNNQFWFARGDNLLKSRRSSLEIYGMETIIDNNKHHYVLNHNLHLFNHKGEIFAKILVAYNVDDYYKDRNTALRKTFLNAIVLLIAMFLILNYYMRYFFKKTNILNNELIEKTRQLKKVNNSLEDKVNDGVKKNREKDKHMLYQSRLAQMGEMISMIAHQWRQPLSTISSTSIDLSMQFHFDVFDLSTEEGKEKQEKYFLKELKNIDNYIQSLTTTINDFRNFYKHDKKTIKININEPIQKALDIIEKSLISDNIKIIQEYNSHNEIEIFDSEVMQVFLSILKNAQDHFSDSDLINKAICIKTEDIASGVIVKISNNGGKIKEDILPFIFDPYFSTKLNKNGTGLGLYMSKIIIEEHHGGVITADNDANWAVFTMTFNEAPSSE